MFLVIKKGDQGDCMYIIMKGECAVYIEDIENIFTTQIQPTAVIG